MNTTAQDWIQEGLEHTEAGDFPQALTCFQHALEIDPASAHAWYCLGCAHNETGNRKEAARAFQSCTKHAPDRKEGWYNLGNCLQDLGALQEAESCFQVVVRIDPEDADGWINLGRLLDDRGEHQAALECYDTALPLAPEDVVAWTNRGNSLAALDRHADAEKSYRKALEIDADFGIAYLAYGKMLVSLDRAADAVPVLSAGAKRLPAAEIWFYLGLALARLKRGDEATAALKQSCAFAGDDPDLWNNIGEVYFMLENFRQALVAYDTARQKAPGYYPACYGKARSHLMLGQKAQAKEACQQFLAAAEPNDSFVPTVRKMLAMCD
jgi:tetratricopeptide (TPR) repeat protein